MKQALTIGVYNPALIYQASPYPGDNVFAKGLEKNGYNVTRFDYRAIQNTDNELLTIANNIKPDLFWFGKCERINSNTLRILKSRFPEAFFIKWAADMRIEPTAHDLGHLKYIDLFVATFAGDYLKKHKKVMPKKSKAINIFTFTDSEYYRQITVEENFKSDTLWTGRLSIGDNFLRNDIIKFLSNSNFNSKIFGLKEWLGHPEYLYYINGTKIGVGSNSFNRRKYSSDRLGNYMSCGTFYLTQYIEGLEECFERGKELDWFETIEEMEEKIKYYLVNEEERIKIAKNGKNFILKYFDTKPLVKNILSILYTGKTNQPWVEIY